MATEERPRLEDRIDLRGRNLRQHAARGTIINSGFQVGLAGLGFLRRIVIAAFLTRAEFGIWGLLLTTVMTLGWLKEIGVADKYIQQSEPDQEAAYQKAFTLELLLSGAFFVLMIVALPVYALAYGRAEIIIPGLVLAASVPISAFESPVWIAYRRMQFVRQRTLAAIDPVTTTVATIALGAAGAGYWSLVLGTVVGSAAGAVAAVATCPYRMRLRFHRDTVREYATFSWPLLGFQMSNIVVTQGLLLVAARSLGVAAVGAIALASVIASFADRVDTIVSETLYPAVCAVAERTELLFEVFLTSNRLALMWGAPFGVGLALFASDLVHFAIGDEWESAIGLLAAFGLMAAFKQVGFNWQIFMRAANLTRPIFFAALVNVASFFVLVVPLVLTMGLTGYVVGSAAGVALQLAARTYYLRRLFPRFSPLRQFLRAAAPTVPPALLVLAIRFVAGEETTLAAGLALFALYAAGTIACTWFIERKLVAEMLGYLRGGGGIRARAQVPSPAEPEATPT